MYFKFQMTENLIRKEKKNIDRGVNALMAEMAHENTLLPDTPLRIVQRVVTFYRGVRPILVVVTKLPIIPPSWTGVVNIFINALDALAQIDVTAEFKAGKDL